MFFAERVTDNRLTKLGRTHTVQLTSRDELSTQQHTMNEKDQTKDQSRAGSLQRGPSREEIAEREQIKANLRLEVRAIREGHSSGGYCNTEKLVQVEKKLHAILSTELEELKARHGYSPDPKFKHPHIRAVEVELNGLAYKPRLVVAE